MNRATQIGRMRCGLRHRRSRCLGFAEARGVYPATAGKRCASRLLRVEQAVPAVRLLDVGKVLAQRLVV